MNDKIDTYIVIGASGGIGSAVTRRLAPRGGRLVLAARGESRLGELADEVSGSADVEVKALDARNADEVSRVIEDAASNGRLRGVVNCAGSIVLKPAHLTSPETFQETLDQNVGTAFNVVRAAVKPLQDAGGGSIVLFGSAAAETGMPNHEAIAAAKAAVAGLTRSAAATYASRGIRVNCIAPGLVDTPMSERITSNDKARERSASMHPLGRIGAPSDVAPIVDWLLGDESSWVTGQVIGIDGGLASLRQG